MKTVNDFEIGQQVFYCYPGSFTVCSAFVVDRHPEKMLIVTSERSGVHGKFTLSPNESLTEVEAHFLAVEHAEVAAKKSMRAVEGTKARLEKAMKRAGLLAESTDE
jgi:hypothetical protein